jgi:hypothetical protein
MAKQNEGRRLTRKPSVSPLIVWYVPVQRNRVYMEKEAGVLILSAVSVTLYCSFLFSVLRPVQINWWRTIWSWGRRRSDCSHRHNNIIQLIKVLFAMKDKRLVFLCWNSYKFSTFQTPRFLLLSFLFLVLLNPITRSVWHGNIFCYIYRAFFADIFVHRLQAFMYESRLWPLGGRAVFCSLTKSEESYFIYLVYV